jgi:hypothetical protein
MGEEIVFSVVGGRVGDTAVLTEDLDTYKSGRRIIVFLFKGPPGNPAATVHPSGLYPSTPLVIEGSVARGPVRNVPLAELISQLAGR